MKVLNKALLLLFWSGSEISGQGFTRQMLNDMAQHFGDGQFPDGPFEQLVGCLEKYGDPRVMQAQDKAWEEFYLHYVNNSSNIYEATKWGGFPSPFRESQEGTEHKAMFGPEGRNYEIQEVCNYVSNVAMFSSTVRLCDMERWEYIPENYQSAAMKLFATLGVSSSWFHGSMMPIGGRWDGVAVALAVHFSYRIVVESLGTTSPILLTVSPDLEPIPIVDMVDAMTFLPLNESMIPAEWWEYLTYLPFNQASEQNVLAYMSVTCAMVYRFWLCDLLIGDIVAPLVLNETNAAFFRDQYLPELKTVVQGAADLPLPLWQKPMVGNRGIGVSFSLLWSIVFQETAIPPIDVFGLFNTTSLGALLTPVMDKVARQFTRMEASSMGVQSFYSEDEVYPGGQFCNRHSSHALWHQLSADSLYELFVIADELGGLLERRVERNQQKEQTIFSRLSSAVRYDGPLRSRQR